MEAEDFIMDEHCKGYSILLQHTNYFLFNPDNCYDYVGNNNQQSSLFASVCGI